MVIHKHEIDKIIDFSYSKERLNELYPLLETLDESGDAKLKAEFYQLKNKLDKLSHE